MARHVTAAGNGDAAPVRSKLLPGRVGVGVVGVGVVGLDIDVLKRGEGRGRESSQSTSTAGPRASRIYQFL